MLSFDVLDKSSPSGESIVVCGAFLNWAAIWAIMLVCDCVVSLKIFNRIERFLDYACMNIASVGLDNIHEMGMPRMRVPSNGFSSDVLGHTVSQRLPRACIQGHRTNESSYDA
jgi:hypothetical protein